MAVGHLNFVHTAVLEGCAAGVQDLCREYSIPTGSYAVFSEPEPAKRYIREQGAPIVVKAVGLAAGKGVVVAHSLEEALAAVDDMLVQQKFGDAGLPPLLHAVQSQRRLCLRPACRSALAAVQPGDAPVCCNDFAMVDCFMSSGDVPEAACLLREGDHCGRVLRRRGGVLLCAHRRQQLCSAGFSAGGQSIHLDGSITQT